MVKICHQSTRKTTNTLGLYHEINFELFNPPLEVVRLCMAVMVTDAVSKELAGSLKLKDSWKVGELDLRTTSVFFVFCGLFCSRKHTLT